MSLRDEHLEDATVVARGEFRLDRRRAMDKLARFQLEHPHRYVLELVAAGVRAGATALRIENDADDFVIEWDGEHPTSDELERLFDHIFTRSSADRPRMLQHLAQGIHGALGLEPRWIHLERPGAALDLTDPLAVTVRESPRREGVRVHVRERFGLAVLKEWASPFRVAHEEELLRADAAWCPIPIEVNGKPLRRPLVGPPPGTRTRGDLWLQDSGEVVVVRDGIRVETLSVGLAPLALCGHVHADGLRLNASRSKAVRDAGWRKVEDGLLQAAEELLIAELHAEVPAFPVAELRGAAQRLLLVRRKGPLVKEPVILDGAGRAWSLHGLRKAEVVRVYGMRGLAAAELDEPQFFQGAPEVELLEAVELTLRDSTRLLEDLAQGRKRRARLRERAEPLEHRRCLLERRFEGEGLRGTAAFDALPAGEVGARLELRVEGLPVEVVALPVAGPVSVRVEGDALQADARFRRVLATPERKRIVRRCIEEAEELVDAVAQAHPGREVVRWTLLEQLTKEEAPGLAADRAPLFDTLDEGRVSLETLRAWSHENGGLRFTRAELVFPFPTPRVLHPDPRQMRALRARFRKLEDVAQELEDRLTRQRRLSSPSMLPKITGYVVARAQVEEEEFHGEIGLAVEAEDDATRVRVLHHGVDLGELKLPLGLPATVAVLELPTAEGDPRMEGLAAPDHWERKLTAALQDPLRALVVASAEAPEPEAPLQAWLEGALRRWRPLPPELSELPLARHADGRSFRLADLDQLPEGPIEVLSEHPVSCPPDLGHVLVVDSSRRRVLQAATQRALRDLSQRFRMRQEAHERFLRRAVCAPIPVGDVVAVQVLGDEELRVAVALSTDPEREPSLRARVLYRERLLSTEILPFPVPADAVITGTRVRPDALFNAPADRMALTGATLERSTKALQAWLSFPALPAPARRRLLLHLLRLRERNPEEEAALAKLRAFPLLPRMDGRLARLEEVETAALVPERLAGGSAPDDRSWLIGKRDVRQILEAAEIEVSDGKQLLEAYRKGQERRRELGRQVLVPGGYFEAFRRIDAEGARHWLGVIRDGTGRIDWLVDDRCIDTEALRYPVRLRIEDPALVASPDFSRVLPGAALTRARERAQELIDRFVEDLARHLGGEDVEGLSVLGSRLLVPCVLSWAHHARREPGVAFLPTSTGGREPLGVLRGQAAQGGIRVAPAGTRGAPADPDRPVFVVEREHWPTLRLFGSLVDYSEDLAKEVAAQARREAEPRPVEPNPEAPGLVLSLSVEGRREGFLQVHRDGRTELELHIGWRHLGRIAHGGPVPFVGHVSDPALEADSRWAGPADGPELQALRRFLAERSQAALRELLEAGPPYPPRLWLVILRRTFRHCRDIPKPGPGSWKRQVAGLPLFRTADGQELTPWDLTQLRHPVRWVTPVLAAPSPDPKRPFVVLDRALVPMASEFFGGELEKEAALEARRIQSRRAREPQPFALDARTYAEERIEGAGWKALVALDVELGAGRIAWRCGGVPLDVQSDPRLGLAAVVEVERAKPDFTGPKPDARREEALDAAYVRLIGRSAVALREAWFGRRRLAAALRQAPEGVRRLWEGAPLLETPSGWTSCAEVRASVEEHEVVLLGSSEGEEGPLVLDDDKANVELLTAFGLGGEARRLGPWRAAREAEVVRKRLRQQDQERARAHNRFLGALRKQLVRLQDGLRPPHAARGQAVPDLLPSSLKEAAMGDPEGPAIVYAAWYLADLALVQEERFDDAREVALRVGEAVSAMGRQGR